MIHLTTTCQCSLSATDIHKLSAALLCLRCPGLFDTPRCVYFLVMCKGLKGNPRKPSPYLLQTASARLESSPCILSYQRDSEEQSDQPDSEEQGYQLDMWGQCTPGLCWKAFSSMIGTKQPLTYGRKQRLRCYSTQQLRRRRACHQSKPDRAYALGCVKIVKNKHDHLPNVRAS